MSGFQSSARLTGSLLASKGAAAPSQTVSSLMEGFTEAEPARAKPAVQAHGFAESFKVEPVKCVTEPETSPERQAIDGAPGERKTAPNTASNTAPKGRIKLSLRLNADQHLRLKLAAAHLRESSQTILIAALDEYLAKSAPGIRDGDCSCLSAQEGAPEAVRRQYGEPYGNAD